METIDQNNIVLIVKERMHALASSDSDLTALAESPVNLITRVHYSKLISHGYCMSMIVQGLA